MEALFGSTILTKNGPVPTADALQGKTVGIYFSAHWCPPCRAFTPVLAKLYNEISKSHPFEIVFVSSDRDEGSFDEYYGEMPWLALPFAQRDVKAKLSSKFNVAGIPSLVIVDEAGKTITTDGRAAITGNPKGFPWAPKPLSELIGDELRKPDGSIVSASSIQGKTLALYFSAHWCPPCRGFTPVLAELYKTMKASGRDDFEFIFVSSDKDEKTFNEYHGSQPWLALPFSRREEKEHISDRFGIQGIPSLVVVDPQGNVINKNARGAAGEDPTGANFPWPPKKMEELSTTVESNGFDINTKTAVIVMCDGAEPAVKAQCALDLLTVANELSVCEDPDFIFFTAATHADPVPQVKKLCSLPEELVEKPFILILDIPDNGGFYIVRPDAVNQTSINSAIASYEAKQLARQQLARA